MLSLKKFASIIKSKVQTTSKKLFRLTHRESGGEMKKTFGYGTKMESDDQNNLPG